MSSSKIHTAKKLLEEALNELESTKGSISNSVHKVYRAAKLVNENDLVNWCESQIGRYDIISLFKNLQSRIEDNIVQITDEEIKTIKNAGLPQKGFEEELSIRIQESSGGLMGIQFAEERYNDLVRTKKGNDGTYYKTNLYNYLSFVKKETHRRASDLYNKIAFSELPSTTFDILKNEIDDRLFDIDPEMTENLLIAFRSVNGNVKEEWSQAFNTCRRIIIKLADYLFPPNIKLYKERPVGNNNYINRLWAFMDKSIESKTNKELAQAHLEYLRIYLDKDVRLLNKGIHDSISKIEAVKTVFHTYLLIADIFEFLEKAKRKSKSYYIKSITYENLTEDLKIRPDIAKKIIKFRVKNETLTAEGIGNIQGVGKKTIEKIIENIEF